MTQVNQRSQTILMSGTKKRVAKSTHCFSSVKPKASHDALPPLFMCQKPYTDSAAPLLFPSSRTFQPCHRNPSVVQGLFRVQVLWGCSRSFGMVQLGGGGTRRCVCACVVVFHTIKSARVSVQACAHVQIIQSLRKASYVFP